MIPNNKLKRGMWTYIEGPHLGKVIIIIKYIFGENIKTLILTEDGNSNKEFPKELFEELENNEIIEWVCQLPEDVFSNYKNTWKKNNR